RSESSGPDHTQFSSLTVHHRGGRYGVAHTSEGLSLRDRTARRAVATSSAGDAGLAMLCVIGALALAWMFTYGAGGSKTVFPHAFYVPVVMTAIRFRARGALIMSVVAGLAAGPLMPLDVAARTAQPTLN